ATQTLVFNFASRSLYRELQITNIWRSSCCVWRNPHRRAVRARSSAMQTRWRLTGLSTTLLLSACVAHPPTDSTTSGGPLIIPEVRHDVSPLPLSQTPASATLPQANDELGRV